jgi:hypothetical protein
VEQFVADTGTIGVPTYDCGITGPVFFEHVRRLRRPLVNSPKGQATPIIVVRAVGSPAGRCRTFPERPAATGAIRTQARASAGIYHGRGLSPGARC